MPTTRELVERWDKRCGVEPVALRVQQQAELTGVADDLLLWLQDELRQDDPQGAILTE